jgi:hypothetical protein
MKNEKLLYDAEYDASQAEINLYKSRLLLQDLIGSFINNMKEVQKKKLLKR